MRSEFNDAEPTCPTCPLCGHVLEVIDGEGTGLEDIDRPRTPAYVCPLGCRAPTGEMTFEFAECPVCGSYDTTRGAARDGAEELECRGCGAIVAVQFYRPEGLG